jgi:signal transduction histidine kinase
MPNADFTADVAAIARIEAVPIILKMMKRITGLRFATVARVTETRWVTCAVDDTLEFGLRPGDEIPLETTICHEIRQHRQAVVFGHASRHPVFSSHHTPRLYELESYISIPIVQANGKFFGTLCALDRVPADLQKENLLETLSLFAQLIATNLDMQSSLDTSTSALATAHEAARLQSEFVAVLGHDLRTPLAAVQMSAELLDRKLVDRQERKFASTILKSAKRMGSLIEDVLDLARGRLGGGIPVDLCLAKDLQATLQAVVNEIRTTFPAITIEQTLSIPAPVFCDSTRLGQLLSNLLANAAVHGSKDDPVQLKAKLGGDSLIIEVRNQGPVIPEELMPLLFQPFTRSAKGRRAEGLGLGLYIAAQIVDAHQGTLIVSSDPDTGTCFTATLPIIPS